MSATPARCFRCSAWAPRSGRSTPCSSPTTPATAIGPARCSPATQVRALVDGDRRARRAARTATRCCPATWATPAIGEAILDAVARVRAANPARRLLLRPGDRRRRRRRLCPPRHRRDPARPHAAGGRHRHAEPLRAGALTGIDLPHARRGEGGGGAAGRAMLHRTGRAACC